MVELLLGVSAIVAVCAALGHGKDDLYDTTKTAACTEEDYELAEKIKNL